MSGARWIIAEAARKEGFGSMDACARHADAILRALDAAGMCVVPKEATPAMVEKVRCVDAAGPLPATWSEIWRAMVAAAGSGE